MSGSGSNLNLRVVHLTQLDISSEVQACGSTGTSTGVMLRLESTESLLVGGAPTGWREGETEAATGARGGDTGKLWAGGKWELLLEPLLLLVEEEEPEELVPESVDESE